MIPPAIEDFIHRLKEATDDSEIDWHTGAADSFYCDHKSYSLHFTYFFNIDEGLGSYHFKIKTGEKEMGFAVYDNETDSAFMSNFYSSVGVNAANLENIVEDFFD